MPVPGVQESARLQRSRGQITLDPRYSQACSLVVTEQAPDLKLQFTVVSFPAVTLASTLSFKLAPASMCTMILPTGNCTGLERGEEIRPESLRPRKTLAPLGELRKARQPRERRL